MRGRLLWSLIMLATVAGAQTRVASGPGVGAGFGAGAGRAVFLNGRYLVFYTSGGQLQFVITRDGLSFSPPQPVGGPASEGYAVASFGDRLGLAWGNQTAGVWTLRYAEALDSGGAIIFGAPEVVSTSTDVRGRWPALAFSTGGTPVIVSLDFNNPYLGSLNGCGGPRTFRTGPSYRLPTGWQYLGYCNDFVTTDPAVGGATVTPLSSGAVLYAASRSGSTNLNTGVVDPTLPPATADLGEPWALRNDPAAGFQGQLSSAPSRTTGTDVHHVYVATGGAIRYTRQNGLSTSNGAAGLDVTTVAAAGTAPAIAEPAAGGGCFSVAWVEGQTIVSRTFQGSISTLGPPRTAFTRPTAPRALTLTRGGVAAMASWMEGDTLMLAPLISGTQPITVSPMSLPADGRSTTTITAGPFLDACGAPVAAGTLITVSTGGGVILDQDVAPSLPGVQLAADATGAVTFVMRSPQESGAVEVAAVPASGGAPVGATVAFVAIADAGLPAVGDGGSAPDAGAEVDAGVEVDAGLEVDAGAEAPDGGRAVDAGAATPDGGSPVVDAGAGAEAPCADPATCGSRELGPPRAYAVGCGCGGSGGALGLTAFALLGLTVRRRTRRG